MLFGRNNETQGYNDAMYVVRSTKVDKKTRSIVGGKEALVRFIA